MLVITRIIKDPQVRRAELIDAALQLFLTSGYEKTMIIDIVKKAGVAKGTFYYYFPSKEAILEAIIASYATEVVLEIETIGLKFTALHKLELFIDRLFIPNKIDIIFDKLWDKKQFDLIYKIWQQAEAVFNPLLSDIIKQGNQEGTMHVLLIDETIAFLWSTFTCLWEASYNKDTPETFTNKVKIGKTVLERILGIAEETFALTISQQ